MHRQIFTVGDSHSLRCFEQPPHIADSTALFGYNKLDGKTAFNLTRHEKQVRKIRRSLRDKHIFLYSVRWTFASTSSTRPPRATLRPRP